MKTIFKTVFYFFFPQKDEELKELERLEKLIEDNKSDIEKREDKIHTIIITTNFILTIIFSFSSLSFFRESMEFINKDSFFGCFIYRFLELLFLSVLGVIYFMFLTILIFGLKWIITKK